MAYTNRAIIAQDVPLRLTGEEMKYPAKVVAGFFETFDLEDCREILWRAFSSTLCLDDETLGSDVTRIELLSYYEEMERLVEAVFLLNQLNNFETRLQK
jgi:hypothetical protein